MSSLKKFLKQCESKGITHVKIGPRSFELTSPKRSVEILDDEPDDLDGLFAMSASAIALSPEMESIDYIKSVLMHEIFHAMASTYGFGYAAEKWVGNDRAEFEEFLAEFFAYGILAFLKDNPALVKVLSRG